MKYVLMIAAVVLFSGCAARPVLDTSGFVTRGETWDCINLGDVLTAIEAHRQECIHACDSK